MKSTDREAFRDAVFERDSFRCVVCPQHAVDAHHLYERQLWPDGGYIIDNGVSLCEKHHREAELTLLPIEVLADYAGIKRVPLPPTLESGNTYDKWGNVILEDGRRSIGPLCNAPRFKFLEAAGVIFAPYYKYPRTPHLPWSMGRDMDDIVTTTYHENYEIWNPDFDVVITEKMDGENTTIYHDHVHARSLDSSYHPSRSWVKNFAAQWQHELRSGNLRVCGENVYATHSIAYENLPTYFFGFSLWHSDFCHSWDGTLEYFELLGITPARVLFEGHVSDAMEWCKVTNDPENQLALYSDFSEGYVIRPRRAFTMSEFPQVVAKYVRPNHVTTETHWKSSQVIKNKLGAT